MVRVTAEAGRPVVMGRNGAISSGHPLASLAGIEILRQGGNAADAAVTVAAALNVVEPHMSGLGGDAFILVRDGRTGRVQAINATGPAPTGTTLEHFRDGVPERGPLSASVPGAFSGWVTLNEEWGTLSLGAVLEPAIRLARDGFPVSHRLAEWLGEYHELLTRYPTSQAAFFPLEWPPSPGHILEQPDLAATLGTLAEGGHDAFYRGEVGADIARAVQGAGGLLGLDSLAAFRAEIVEPLSVDYRGYTVYAPPPNSTGHVLLQELAMFARFDPADYAPLSAELIHLMVEIKKRAFEDRERFNGDPRFTGDLPGVLFSSDHIDHQVASIDPWRARPSRVSTPASGDHTTYFATADRDGNIVSVTTSINMAFGSGFVAGRTGIVLNNRMTYWHLEPDHPNSLLSGKRVRHTISPALVLRDGAPVLAIGTPGSDGQVQTIFQVLVYLLDYGINPQVAVEMPRWRSYSRGHESNLPHGLVDALHVEGRMPPRTVEGLQARRHRVVRLDRWGPIGSCQLIQVSLEDGLFAAAADPRRDAYALAW